MDPRPTCWLLLGFLLAVLVAGCGDDGQAAPSCEGAACDCDGPNPPDSCFAGSCETGEALCSGPRTLRSCADERWETTSCEGDDICSLGGCVAADSYDGAWILYDDIHSTKQNPGLMLQRYDYNYQGMHGFSDLFDHLEYNGYAWQNASVTSSTGTLTPELLGDYQILFINLVSSDRPDFTTDEIKAVQDWVEAGGGLFVIADHTNVYYHAQRLNPLLEPMGIVVEYVTAVDPSQNYAIGGGAWLKIRNFADHPVTAGVEVASFQTGGAFDTEHGVAFTSEGAFGDFWIESPDEPGFYGNWTRDPGETEGMLPVVAANQFGEGRVVVVGDQNIFGDEWIHVGNNFELASNIFEWVAGNEDNDVPLRDRRQPGFHEVGFELERSEWNLGWNGCSGFFPFYINFNRSAQVVARGVSTIADPVDVQTWVVANPRQAFGDVELAAATSFVEDGGTLVLVLDVVAGERESWQLAAELLPNVTFVGSSREVPITELPSPSDFETITGTDQFPVMSDMIDADGLRVAGHVYPTGASCSEDIEEADPYLVQVSATGGTPLLQADLGDDVADLARVYDVGAGRIVLLVQFGFWRNETLGWERQIPTESNTDAHELQYRFIDWLAPP